MSDINEEPIGEPVEEPIKDELDEETSEPEPEEQPTPEPETLPTLLPETFTAACHSAGFDPTRTATLILKSDGTITAIANEITEVPDARNN